MANSLTHEVPVIVTVSEIVIVIVVAAAELGAVEYLLCTSVVRNR